MNIRPNSSGGALLAASLLAASLLAPALAQAGYVLDTGAPSNTNGSSILTSSAWFAAEFDVTNANETINQLAAYLDVGNGKVNDTFNVDIYSTTNFTGRSNQRSLLYSTTGTFTANGWNDVTTNWTPAAAGDYWVALQVSSSTQTKGLFLPGAGITTASATTPSGTAPALAFASAGTNGQFTVESTTAPTTPFGIQLSQATPVPLPAGAWLLLSGLLGGVGTLARKRKAA